VSFLKVSPWKTACPQDTLSKIRPAKMLLACFFPEQLHEAGTGRRRSLWRRGQRCSVCSARKTAVTGRCRMHHISRGYIRAVNSRPSSAVSACCLAAARPSGVCLYACMPWQQHGSTAALGHSLGFIAVSAGVRSV